MFQSGDEISASQFQPSSSSSSMVKVINSNHSNNKNRNAFTMMMKQQINLVVCEKLPIVRQDNEASLSELKTLELIFKNIESEINSLLPKNDVTLKSLTHNVAQNILGNLGIINLSNTFHVGDNLASIFDHMKK